MTATTTATATEFNRNPGAAKRDAEHADVVVTDHGEPTHVLMTWARYQEGMRSGVSIVDVLADEGSADIEFNPRRLRDLPRPMEL